MSEHPDDTRWPACCAQSVKSKQRVKMRSGTSLSVDTRSTEFAWKLHWRTSIRVRTVGWVSTKQSVLKNRILSVCATLLLLKAVYRYIVFIQELVRARKGHFKLYLSDYAPPTPLSQPLPQEHYEAASVAEVRVTCSIFVSSTLPTDCAKCSLWLGIAVC